MTTWPVIHMTQAEVGRETPVARAKRERKRGKRVGERERKKNYEKVGK